MNLYRKFKPTTIFTGTTMLTDGQVVIAKADGSIAEILPETEAGDDIEQINGILGPGFVNAHCHIELSHMKGIIPAHTGLVEFVKQVILKRETPGPGDAAAQSQAFIERKQKAIKAAVNELWESGTVAIGDICNTTDSLELKSQSKLHWHNLIEVSGFVDAVADKRFDTAAAVLKAFEDRFPQYGNSLVPHAPYSVSKTLFELISNHSRRNLISIHNQETRDEDELYLSKGGGFLGLYKDLGISIDSFSATGRSSMQSWLRYFDQQQKIISVHNTFAGAEDLQAVAAGEGHPNLFFCICINANLYIENSLPPVELLMRSNQRMVIGTDSYASNDQLNMLAEIRSIQKAFPKLDAGEILRWATLNGAEALGIESKYGSIEKGKKPGLVVIEQDFSSSRLLLS